MAATLSIIIPVYREGRRIQKCTNRLESLDFPWPVEIIIADGEPEMTTCKKLVPGSRIPVISLSASRGRGPQLNAGAGRATGKVLLFLHVDTRLDQRGVDLLSRTLDAQNAPWFCGAFDLAIDSPRRPFRCIEQLASLRSRLTRLPYGDQAIFVSSALFKFVNGFPDYPIMEDVALMQRIKRTRIRPIFIPHRVVTSARRWQKQGLIYTTIRNWTLILLYLVGVHPRRLNRFY